MRPLILDMPNGRELIDELDFATGQMMSLSVEHIGGAKWLEATRRQQQAFTNWREYLHRMADWRIRVDALNVA
ncbi:hypothetical protein [Pseudomonas sp. LB3P31]